jgi:hypothetical protein
MTNCTSSAPFISSRIVPVKQHADIRSCIASFLLAENTVNPARILILINALCAIAQFPEQQLLVIAIPSSDSWLDDDNRMNNMRFIVNPLQCVNLRPATPAWLKH